MSTLWNNFVDMVALAIGGRLWERRVRRWLAQR